MSSVTGESLDSVIVTKFESIDEDFTTKFSRLTQYYVGSLFKPLFHLFFEVKVIGQENILRAKSPLIIIANHISFYDSFLFRLITPYELLPLRFMGIETFVWPFLRFLHAVGIINFIYSLFGVFVVVPGRGLQANLAEAKQIIKNGGIVTIYPEGEIHPGDDIGQFKKGASVLAQQTRVPILPVAFRIGKCGLLRRKVFVNIGPLIHLPEIISDVRATEMMRDSVVTLFNGAK